MTNQYVLIKRNTLMVRILWGISLLFIAFASISDVDKKSLFLVDPILIIISLITTILIWKSIATSQMMYIISFGLSLVHFLFVFVFHDLNGFLIAFIILAIISLYQNY